MYLNIKAKILELFTGSERTQIVKKNIAGSFVIKGLSILTTLILVPLTINLLDQEKYGIWMTIFSIVSWFNMMDVGIGNGFRNKFAEAVALNNNVLAKDYVQTFYSSMGIIASVFLIFYSIVNPFLNWQAILNLPINFNENIGLIVWAVFALFCVQLYVKSISTLLLSLQKTSLSDSLMLCGNIVALLFILLLRISDKISLLSISMAFMTAPILVYVIVTVYSFNNNLRQYRPKIFSMPKKEYLNDLIGLGLKFFYIQITGIIIFSSSNIIVAQLFGPAQVTPFNVANRLFATAQSFFTIITTPFWSAFTDANALKDYKWIKKSIKSLMKIWVLFTIGVLIIWILSPEIIHLWIGSKVNIPLMLSLQFAIQTIIATFQSPFVFYIYGSGKLKLIFYITIFQSIIYIPMAFSLAKISVIGMSGIMLATNICLLIPCVFAPIQYHKLVNNKAFNIWNK
jgi:O-antigen/teichoic acid export membrane protein